MTVKLRNSDLSSYDAVVRDFEYSLYAPEPIYDLIESELTRITNQKSIFNIFFQKAIEQGKSLATNEIKTQIRKYITTYLESLISIASKIKNELSNKIDGLTISNYQAKFTPTSQEISFFIIVEYTDFNKDIEFSLKFSTVPILAE